jgi:hypothetical protein
MRGSTTAHNRHNVPTADIAGDKKFLWKNSWNGNYCVKDTTV